ncbi:ninein [Chelonus insularis]|uniref:ninein n=1 Tax=Chelonus insularis TaxID=460826 RepID=UPI00158F2DF7|nr:ninein [Chelonus insularis]
MKKKHAMESKNCNPYEQRLLSVYESCLEKGESQLGEKGLRILCEKLQLEERGTELISNLLKQTPTKYTITFEEFRNGLVSLLDESREDENSFHDKVIDDSSIMTTLKYEEPTILSPIHRKIGQFYTRNGNRDANTLIINGGVLNHIDESEKQMLGQIFQKLDVDCDGLISFNEFMLLFQDAQNHENHSIHAEWEDNSPDESTCGKNSLNILGPDHTGYIDSRSIINLWQMAGVADGKALLRDLSFNTDHINLSDLLHVLNEELKSLQHEPKDSIVIKTHVDLLRATVVLYQEEVKSVNGLIDQLTKERDKLKVDVMEANERADILAAEIDENHAKLEKSRLEQIKILENKHAELIKDLTLQHSCERDAQMATLKLLNDQLQVSQHEEQQIKNKLADALNDNQTLEADNQNLSDQVTKLKISNNQLLMQVQALAAECDEAEANDERENEQVISLVDRIKRLQSECALLRDQNDELTSELELLKSRTGDNRKSSTIISFSDSEESNSVTDYEPLAKQVPEFKNLEKSNLQDQLSLSVNSWYQSSNELDEKKISNISQTLASIISDLKTLTVDNKICTLDCALRRNISEIISELETHGKEIIAEKKEDSETIEKNEEEECEERASESLRDFVVNRNEKSRILIMSSHSNDVINNLDIFNSKNKTSRLRDYPPRREENQIEQVKVEDKTNVNINNTESDVVDSPHNSDSYDIEVIKKDRDRLSALLQEQETKHNNEKKMLQEQCQKLENDLELLKNEYYQCEDYWAGKLEEERQIIEQEQKVTDEKLSELISKIAEYEEQFSAGDKSRTNGRLSPIEEKFSLEQQYVDLEKEFDEYKKHMQEVIAEKDKRLNNLEEELKKFQKEKADLSVLFSEDHKCKRTAYQPVYQFPQRGKLNKIAEHSTSNDDILLANAFHSVICHICGSYTSPKELSRMQDIAQRLVEKRVESSLECNSLMEKKERLIKELLNATNFSTNQQGLRANIKTLEKRQKSLRISLKRLEEHTNKIIEYIWKQRASEVSNLKHMLNETQESLAQQVQINTINMEKLVKSDLLLKDLYVENTHLKAKVDRLGERCHMLVNIDSKSTSV